MAYQVLRLSWHGSLILWLLVSSVYLNNSSPQLYKPGPGQTLENFVVHLRNRNHRNNVHKRVMEQGGEPLENGNVDGSS